MGVAVAFGIMILQVALVPVLLFLTYRKHGTKRTWIACGLVTISVLLVVFGALLGPLVPLLSPALAFGALLVALISNRQSKGLVTFLSFLVLLSGSAVIGAVLFSLGLLPNLSEPSATTIAVLILASANTLATALSPSLVALAAWLMRPPLSASETPQ